MKPHDCPEDRDPLAWYPVHARAEEEAESRRGDDYDFDGRMADREAGRYERGLGL